MSEREHTTEQEAGREVVAPARSSDGQSLLGGTKTIPKNAGTLSGNVFFDEHVTRNARIIDKGVGDEHGVYTHLLQDLVVDRALRAAGRSENGLEFSQLLGRAEGLHDGRVTVGDLIWRVTYDTEAGGHISEPESLREALGPFGLR